MAVKISTGVTKTRIFKNYTGMYYCYLLRCADGTLYCGSTTDIQRRLRQHNSGAGSIYVRTHGGGKIIYTESFATLGAALRREVQIKKLTRRKKESLIQNSLAQ